jgi:hypothetical protein
MSDDDDVSSAGDGPSDLSPRAMTDDDYSPWTTAVHGTYPTEVRLRAVTLLVICLGRRADGTTAYPQSQLARLSLDVALDLLPYVAGSRVNDDAAWWMRWPWKQPDTMWFEQDPNKDFVVSVRPGHNSWMALNGCCLCDACPKFGR